MPKLPPRKDKPFQPFWSTSDGETVKLYHGHVLNVLKKLPPQSVHMVVTSPPYWGLRDYGTGTWEGGDPECQHVEGMSRNDTERAGVDGLMSSGAPAVKQFCGVCGVCGAVRNDEQLGNEETPQEFVDNLAAVFSEVHRVLRDDGTVWLNLGDTYLDGNLVGIPWRTALALQDNGWILRQDIIWHKPSPMPESVKNRCTKAHEYIFLLTKSMRYYYDAEAIKEEAKSEKVIEFTHSNKRSVWTVSSQGYDGAHYAVFPPKLIEPCILAGTSARGCCTQCGAPWDRIVEEKKLTRDRPNDYVKRTGEEGTGNSCANTVAGVDAITLGWYPTCPCDGLPPVPPVPPAGKDWNEEKAKLGLRKVMGNGTGADMDMDRINKDRTKDAAYQAWLTETKSLCAVSSAIDTKPCTVLDTFIGSGTTCAVSLQHGRHSVGIDLSDKYLRGNAIPRVKAVLSKRPEQAHLAGHKAERVEVGERVEID